MPDKITENELTMLEFFANPGVPTMLEPVTSSIQVQLEYVPKLIAEIRRLKKDSPNDRE